MLSVFATQDEVFYHTKTVFKEQDGPKVCTFVSTLNPHYPLKMAEVKKIIKIFQKNKFFFLENFNHWAIQICQNQDPIFSSLFGKNAITFALCGPFLVGNRGGSHFQGSE